MFWIADKELWVDGCVIENVELKLVDPIDSDMEDIDELCVDVEVLLDWKIVILQSLFE